MSTRPKVLLTRRWTDAAQTQLAQRFELTINQDDRPMNAAALLQALRTHDAICTTVTDSVTAALLNETGLRSKLIANFGVGFNHIDVQAARSVGIAVSNTPDVVTDATADLALLLMLMTARRAGEGERELRDGRWTGWRPTHLLGQDLRGKLLGLVGFGRIAQATAHRALHGFGMRIAYFGRRRADAGIESALQAQHYASLDDLLQHSDVISLHLPGGVDTHHLLDARRLALLKPSALLINTARGTVIDEAALADVLARSAIGGAGLDVYEREPVVHPGLLALDNVVLLPHQGTSTLETRTAMGLRVGTNLDAFFAGLPLPDPVV
ncbi:MAG: D-glycerate dehydrogenase [Proteobacteria bacterium]|nr:D-glycerate dehydrogenase [Pseudomonadota bacterium]